MGDKSWKAFERRLAGDVGGRRIPVTGIDRDGCDVVDGMFHYQAKLRRRLPTWMFTWLRGIVGTAERANKVGVLVLKVPRMKDDDALVIVRWKDWRDLHGDRK